MTGDELVRCTAASRTYGTGPAATVALQPTECVVRPGDLIAVAGPSGSGKSTLLHLLAGLDRPTRGEITWPAIGDRASLRPGRVAMIHQGPSLLAPLTVRENVALPLVLDGVANRDAQAHADAALRRLGVHDLADKLPEEISGGQSQRVAVTRALAGRPQLILADEPTGQLDSENGAHVVDVLLEAAAAAGAALVVTTHDPAVADRLPHRWQMHSGRLLTIAAAAGAPRC